MSDWFQISRIDDYTFALCEHGHWERMNSYLLIGNTHAMLVDTGLGIDNIKNVVKSLTQLPVIVATTHVHWDHIGGHSLFHDICVHEQDSEWLRNGIPLPVSMVREMIIKEEFYKKPPKEFDISRYSVFTGEPARILEDGDIIDLGGRRIIAIHTPGHSPGHTCYFDENHGYLFSGDLVYMGTLYCNYPSTDPIQYKRSIDKISRMTNICKVFPSHNEMHLSKDIIDKVKAAFENIESKGVLRHGSGCFKFEDFSILL